MEFVQARNYTRVTTPARTVALVVLHTMEYPERPTGAEWCASYFAGTSAPRASAHYMVDNDTVVQGVRDEDVAWAAPGANHNGLQIEHAGYAAQGTADWADAYSSSMLALSARLVAKLCARHSLPVRFVDAEGIKAGRWGITTHAEVTKAFPVVNGQRMTHWDPGPNFPMNTYIAAVKSVTAAEEEPIVKPWIPVLFHWYLFDRPEGKPRPAGVPEPPYPKEFWAMVDAAAQYRETKPVDDREAAALRAKIAAAQAALA